MRLADQGGCMLVMHAGTPMFPSKTDHIMSRYRPIAPKPVPKTEGTDQTDSHSLSSQTADKSTTKSEYRGKRSRKRPPDSKSPRPLKKTRHGTSSGSMSGKSVGAEVNVEFQPTNFNLTPIFSDRVAPVFGPGGLQRFKDSFDQSQNGVSVSLSLSSKSPPRDSLYGQEGPIDLNNNLMCSRDGLSFNVGTSNAEGLERDTGFVERAAANSPVLYSAEHSHTQSFRRDSFLGCNSVSTSFGADSEVCSAEDAAESRRANLVTLSLLPNTPSHANTRSSSSSSTLSLFSSDIRWPLEKQATPSSDLNTSLTMSSKGQWSEESASLPGGAAENFGPVAVRGFVERVTETSLGDGGVVDAHNLEQRHGGSSEAVMLTDESDRVLWANSAFKRLSSERMSNRIQAIGPHIDPLGIRTQLAILTFQPPFPAPKCKAVLWGFLKKFTGILHEGGNQNAPNFLEGQTKVIAPQPVRAVGSTINIHNIVSLDPHAVPMTENFELVREKLDHGDMPSVITDLRFRVRWVNAAYKRLVGQPKLAWLASTVGGSADEESLASSRLAGDVSLVCDVAHLPAEIAAFTCRVGIQWSHQGEHNAMSVPSKVVRLDDESVGSMYVWGFDVCDAGVKNVLQIKDTSPYC